MLIKGPWGACLDCALEATRTQETLPNSYMSLDHMRPAKIVTDHKETKDVFEPVFSYVSRIEVNNG